MKPLIIVLLLALLSCTKNDNSMIHLEKQPWQMRTDPDSLGLTDSWFAERFDRSSWHSAIVGASTQRVFDTTDGYVWFATSITVEESTSARSLYFGGIDDAADVWLNGRHIGFHSGSREPFVLETFGRVRSGRNHLVVRVNDFGGPGGIVQPIILCDSAAEESLLRTKFSAQSARESEAWVRNAVIYEVSLRSFSTEGTFAGLERRISELKRLGVTVLWLTPIHPVGELNRKGTLGNLYSVQDYYGINFQFGSESDLRSLVKTVHAHGMKIILDLVANHTSWDSRLMFDHSNWFTHDDSGAIIAPTLGWNDVADLNFDQHELRKYMIEMMKYWVREYDIDGYRCDVAELVPTEFWEVARKELEKIKPVMMVSDGSLPEHHLEAFDITYSWNLYDLFSNTFQDNSAADDIQMLLKNESYIYPKNALRLRFSTAYDRNILDAPAARKFTAAGSKLAALLAFTLPGIPLIHNGEEVGNDKRLDLSEKVSIDWSKGEEFRTLYSTLARMRSEHPVFADGAIQFVASRAEPVVAFVRSKGGDRVLIAVNCSSISQRVVLDCSILRSHSLTEFFSGAQVELPEQVLTMNLGAYGYAVFLAKDAQ